MKQTTKKITENKSKQIPKKTIKQKKTLADESKKKALESMSKCLAMSLVLSKEAFENLSPDAFKTLFKDWTLRELKLLNKIYNREINEIGE